MNPAHSVTQSELPTFLLNVALRRPVFLWGAPGIGKSALVEAFAASLGLNCVSLLGSQLAPEDIIGVPKIEAGKSVFCPPVNIARNEPYCLFLDELNACSQEVQKAFYSLIHDRRIGEYHLPEGSVVIGAGNRAQDHAIVKTMSSALVNRMVHVHLRVSSADWMKWAATAAIDARIQDYLRMRPDHLWSKPPKHEEPFSTPRAWHMLSDTLQEFGEGLTPESLAVLAHGTLSPAHAAQFCAFIKNLESRHQLEGILAGKVGWPSAPEDRDVLYFLAQSFRARLIKELPEERDTLKGTARDLAFRSKDLIKSLAQISLEIGQVAVAEQDDGRSLPAWFLTEVIRDVPRLVKRDG